MKLDIKNSDIFYEDIVDEELALACLLADGVCFLSHAKGNDGEFTTCIYVLANDIFAWACADCEPLLNNDGQEPSEIIDLYRLWKENNKWGAVKWLCLKRNEQPQKLIEEMMVKDSYWDEKLESLPPNYYWAKLAEENQDK